MLKITLLMDFEDERVRELVGDDDDEEAEESDEDDSEEESGSWSARQRSLFLRIRGEEASANRRLGLREIEMSGTSEELGVSGVSGDREAGSDKRSGVVGFSRLPSTCSG
jgi:hypothetical protein